jgi:DNA-binding transcriptional ArsR family regulator
MSDEEDLFAWARRTDPHTAHDAASSLTSETLAHLQKLVCERLAAHPEGLTTTEIAEEVGLPRDSISPRMKKLTEVQLVVDSGERRVPAGKTRRSIVWRLAA